MTQCQISGCRRLETKCADCGRVACTATLPQMMEWIKCSDRLPENHDLVLITDGKDVTFSFYDHGFLYTQLPYIQKVIWWMPLPKPPEEK